MKVSSENPITNQIGPGISEDVIRSAVDESGYPLQTFVADILRTSFMIAEEWAYVDRDTGELRSLDLRAHRMLFDRELINPQPRVRPALDLLIECKQSELPYVFFESHVQHHLLEHPVVYGLHESSILITTDDSKSSWNFHIGIALGLHLHPFQDAPKVAKTFSKCVRKGSKLELSGTDAYSHLILPLVKAIDHLGIAEKPTDTAIYFDAHLSVALGVLDAPMLVARAETGGTVLELVPWVRVIRHEYANKKYKHNRDRHWVVDIVHKDYFKQYLESKLEPFAAEFAERVLRHPTEIATAKAFVPGMEHDSWHDIESRMQAKR